MELLRSAARTADAAERCDCLLGRDLGVDGRSAPLPPPGGTVRASETVARGRFAGCAELAGPRRDGGDEAAPAEAEAST